jgi:hypothetical protein
LLASRPTTLTEVCGVAGVGNSWLTLRVARGVHCRKQMTTLARMLPRDDFSPRSLLLFEQRPPHRSVDHEFGG